MNYGQVKRAALQLIYSDTIAGQRIPSSYNNQADYERQIPALVDACQQYIATTVKRIPALVRLGDLEKMSVGANELYTLPEDFFQISPGLITVDSDIRHDRFVSVSIMLVDEDLTVIEQATIETLYKPATEAEA